MNVLLCRKFDEYAQQAEQMNKELSEKVFRIINQNINLENVIKNLKTEQNYTEKQIGNIFVASYFL